MRWNLGGNVYKRYQRRCMRRFGKEQAAAVKGIAMGENVIDELVN